MYQATRFTVDKNWKSIIEYLGLNVQSLLREARVPPDIFEKKAVSVSADEYFRMWTAVDNLVQTEVPAPILVAEAIDFQKFSPPVIAAMCSADFVTCVYRLKKFKPLIGPMVLDIDEDDVHFSISISCYDPTMDLHPFVIAIEMIFFLKLIRHATGIQVYPDRIESKEVLKNEQYLQLFGIQPVKGERNRITFYMNDALLPFKTRNETLWGFFEPELKKRLEEVETDTSFSARVRTILMELLPIGKSSIDDVAEKLFTSKRTLQRKLKAENTNYQKQLNYSRELLARHYLAKSDMTSAEISFLIGYDDPSSFSRAFHLWTGVTPESLRAAIA